MNAVWFALIELMGHHKIVGRCSWQSGGMLRIEPLKDDGSYGPTRHYGPGALFCVYPCSEEVARATAATNCSTWGNEGERGLPHWATSPRPTPTEEGLLNGIPAPFVGMRVTILTGSRVQLGATVYSVDSARIVVDVHDSGGSTMSIPVQFWSDKSDSWLIATFDSDGNRSWIHDSEIPF